MDTKESQNQIHFEEKENTKEIYNQDKSKLLILNYIIKISPVTTFNYSVIDTKTKKELKKGVFVGEKMEWLDSTTLKCTKHIGMIEKEDDIIPSSETKNKNINYLTIKID